MTIDRWGRKGQGGGSAKLISHLMNRDSSVLGTLKRTSLLAGGTDRVAGVSSEADYRAPGGLQSPYDNFITVAKDGGDYTSIRDAIDACHDPDATNTYCVFIYPGIYDEQVEVPSYVSLVGLDRDVCVIRSADYATLVTLGSNSSLNEIFVENLADATNCAVYASNVTSIVIDSCIIRAAGECEVSLYAVQVNGCETVRILGSEIHAENMSEEGGVVYAVYVHSTTRTAYVDLRYTKVEIESDTHAPGSGIYLQGSNNVLSARILNSFVLVHNAYAAHHGIAVGGAQNVAYAYIEHTSIEHMSAVGGGYDINVQGDSGQAHVRAARYSTYNTGNGGLILSLMGDRPVRTCLADGTDYTIEAAAGTYVNDPTGIITFEVPCRSDIVVQGNLIWSSDTTGVRSFGARFLLDGALLSAQEYAGQAAVNTYNSYALSSCGSDVDAGTHTIQLQVRRFAIGDIVILRHRQLWVETFPYP